VNRLVDALLVLGIIVIVIIASMDTHGVDDLLHTQSDPYKEV
jgi:hypothetical protein